MILVFILLGISIFLLLIICMMLFSHLKIEIKKLVLSNMQPHEQNDYNITISLYLFGRLKWICCLFNRNKVKQILKKIPMAKIDFKKLEQDFGWQDLKVISNLQPKISYLDLEANIGFKSSVTTAFTVAIISFFISILLPNMITKIESKNYQYHIVPIYQNKNLYKMKLDCIIELKMVHIINVIYIFIKKGRSDKNERTASNRKSHGYSYE